MICIQAIAGEEVQELFYLLRECFGLGRLASTGIPFSSLRLHSHSDFFVRLVSPPTPIPDGNLVHLERTIFDLLIDQNNPFLQHRQTTFPKSQRLPMEPLLCVGDLITQLDNQ